MMAPGTSAKSAFALDRRRDRRNSAPDVCAVGVGAVDSMCMGRLGSCTRPVFDRTASLAVGGTTRLSGAYAYASADASESDALPLPHDTTTPAVTASTNVDLPSARAAASPTAFRFATPDTAALLSDDAVDAGLAVNTDGPRVDLRAGAAAAGGALSSTCAVACGDGSGLSAGRTALVTMRAGMVSSSAFTGVGVTVLAYTTLMPRWDGFRSFAGGAVEVRLTALSCTLRVEPLRTVRPLEVWDRTTHHVITPAAMMMTPPPAPTSAVTSSDVPNKPVDDADDEDDDVDGGRLTTAASTRTQEPLTAMKPAAQSLHALPV